MILRSHFLLCLTTLFHLYNCFFDWASLSRQSAILVFFIKLHVHRHDHIPRFWSHIDRDASSCGDGSSSVGRLFYNESSVLFGWALWSIYRNIITGNENAFLGVSFVLFRDLLDQEILGKDHVWYDLLFRRLCNHFTVAVYAKFWNP